MNAPPAVNRMSKIKRPSITLAESPIGYINYNTLVPLPISRWCRDQHCVVHAVRARLPKFHQIWSVTSLSLCDRPDGPFKAQRFN